MIFAKNTEAFVESGIDGELILMNIDNGNFHTLTGVALAVWRDVNGARTLDDIQSRIAARYAVDRDRCAAEITAFVGQLTSAGFIHAV